MAGNRQVVVDIIGDAKKFTKATDDAVKASTSMADKIKKAGADVKKGFLEGIGIGGGLGVYDTVVKTVGAVVDAVGKSIDLASDQAEALSKVNVVFGKQADEIEAWSRTAASSMGMTQTAALEAAGTLGNLFDGLGIAEDAGRQMSKTITQLAADLGSFNNVSTDEALTALRSGLLGEAEPMRKFGSALSAVRVEAKASAMGLAEMVNVNGKMKPVITESAKVQARYALILEDTKNAQGDFARTADGMANSTKTLNANFEDMKAKIGGALKDAVMPLLSAFVDLANQTPNTSLAVGKLTQHYRDLIEQQKFANEGAQQQGDIFADLYGVIAPQDKQIHEFTGTLGGYARILGVTRKELALFTEAGLTYGDTLDTIRGKLNELVAKGAMERAAKSWHHAATVAETAGLAIYGGLVARVKGAFQAMFSTMKAQKEPWRAAWKEMAAYAKDPFRPAQFENWLGHRADKAVEKAKQAAADGKPAVAARWRALAAVMRRPVLAALAQTEEDIQSLVDAMATIMALDKRIGGFRRNGSTGRNSSAGQHNVDGGVEVGNNAGGTSNWRGGPTWVGERGPELVDLPRGSKVWDNAKSMRMASGGGSPVIINITAGVGDPVAIGESVIKALRAYTGRRGPGELRTLVAR